MSGQHHYTAANPGQQHEFPQKPAPNTGRLPPSQSTILLRWLTGVSALLGLVSLVALAFKCLSSISWNDFEAAPTVELMPAGGKGEGDALFLFPLDLDRHSNYGGLTWAAIVLGLTLAPVTAYCSWRVGKTGPYYYEKPTRLFTYALYHLYWLFPLAVFALLTATHARSAHMATAPITRAATTYGKYAPAGAFDRKTLACEASRLARSMGGGVGGTAPAVEQLGRVCVGEEGTRWLLVGIAVMTAELALILELDRRGGRRFIAATEKGRGPVDARGGFV